MFLLLGGDEAMMSREYNLNLLFYTGKWFLIYSVVIFFLGLAAIVSLAAACMACVGGPSKKN